MDSKMATVIDTTRAEFPKNKAALVEHLVPGFKLTITRRTGSPEKDLWRAPRTVVQATTYGLRTDVGGMTPWPKMSDMILDPFGFSLRTQDGRWVNYYYADVAQAMCERVATAHPLGVHLNRALAIPPPRAEEGGRVVFFWEFVGGVRLRVTRFPWRDGGTSTRPPHQTFRTSCSRAFVRTRLPADRFNHRRFLA